jgi:O-antigen/teichoic acid export membrane protein
MTEPVIRTPVGLSQRGRLGFLLKDSALYGGATAISKAFSLITFPLIARHFSTEDYGVIDFFGVLATFLGVLIIFGQDSAIARFFYEYEETHQRQQLISQSILLQLLLSALAVVVLLIWATPMLSLAIDVPDADVFFTLIVLQVPFLVLMQFAQTLLKWSFQRNRFLLISLGYTLTSVILLLIGIYGFHIGVKEILLIGIISNALYGLLGVWFIRSWLIVPKNLGYLNELVRYALPLGVICSVGAFVPTVERWLTADLLSLVHLGYFAVGTKVAMLITLFVGAFQTAWGPFSLSLYKQDDAIQTYNHVLKIFVLLMVCFSFLLAAIGYPLITLLATDRYAPGAIVVFPLAMGLVIQATSWITEIGITISKRSYLNLYAYLAYVSATLAGIFLFTYFFGLVGVALGVLLGHTAKSGFATILAQQAYPMAWDFPTVLVFLLLSVISGLTILTIYVSIGSTWGSILFAIGGISLGLMGWLTLFSNVERSSIIAWTNSRLHHNSV